MSLIKITVFFFVKPTPDWRIRKIPAAAAVSRGFRGSRKSGSGGGGGGDYPTAAGANNVAAHGRHFKTDLLRMRGGHSAHDEPRVLEEQETPVLVKTESSGGVAVVKARGGGRRGARAAAKDRGGGSRVSARCGRKLKIVRSHS